MVVCPPTNLFSTLFLSLLSKVQIKSFLSHHHLFSLKNITVDLSPPSQQGAEMFKPLSYSILDYS